MKKLMYTSALFLFSLSWTFANHGARHLEGYWHSTCGSNSIEIDAKSYGLKIDGLSRDRKFRANRRNVFQNRSGVLVEIINPRTILVTRNRGNHFRRRTETTKYVRLRRNARNDSRYRNDQGRDNSWYDGDDEYSYRRYDNDGYSSYNGSRPGSYDTDHRHYAIKHREDISGTWRTKGLDLNKRINIVSSSEGIKAKFKSSDKWFFYAQEQDRPNVFTDNRGNRYILESRTELTWIGRDGKRLKLSKF